MVLFDAVPYLHASTVIVTLLRCLSYLVFFLSPKITHIFADRWMNHDASHSQASQVHINGGEHPTSLQITKMANERLSLMLTTPVWDGTVTRSWW